MAETARRVALSSVSQSAGRVLSAALGMATVMVATRYLGVHAYGQLATVTIFLSIFLILTDAGFTNVAVRELARRPERVDEVLGNIVALRGVVGAVLMVAAIGLGALIYTGPANTNVRLGITVLAVTLALNAIQTSLTSVIAAQVQNQLIAVGDVLNKVVVLAGAGLTLAFGAGFRGLVLAYLAGSVVQFASDTFFSLRRARPKLGLDTKFLRGLVVATLPYSAAVILNTLYFRADGFMLSVLKGGDAVGLYSVAYKVVELTMSFPVFFGLAILPLLSEAKHKDDAVRLVWRANRVLALAGAGITLVTMALAPELAVFIGGEPFRAAGLPLAILMAGNFLIYQTTSYAQAQLASDNQANLLRVTSVLLVVNVALNLVLIPRFSTTGAAVAVVVSELLSLLMLRHYFRRTLGPPLPWGETLAPLVPALGAAAMVLLAKALLERLGSGNLPVLLVSGVLGAAAYASLAYLAKLVQPSDFKTLRRGA